MTSVVVSSPLYGDTWGIAVSVTYVGAMVDMQYAPPVGTPLVLHFDSCGPGGTLTHLAMRAEVIAHGEATHWRREVMLVWKGIDVTGEDTDFAATPWMH